MDQIAFLYDKIFKCCIIPIIFCFELRDAFSW
jgi:hypothetical protein